MRNPRSSSIDLSRLCLLALALAASLAFAADAPRPLARDPVLGLRYRPTAVAFEPFPAELLAQCPALTNARWGRELWIFATARDGARAYYVVGGYYVRRAANGGAPRYEPDPRGAVLSVDGDACKLIGPARETFDSRPDEMPADVLAKLSADLVARYARAFGGEDALRAALKRQRVDAAAVRGPLGEALRS